jgi:hypothetical protein
LDSAIIIVIITKIKGGESSHEKKLMIVDGDVFAFSN